MTRGFLAATAMLLLAEALSAQTQAPDPSFEVASIKPNTTSSPAGGFEFSPGGRFVATNFNTLNLIAIAYRKEVPLPASRVIGWPQWLAADRYDIAAKVDSAAPQDVQVLTAQAPGYLRSLLTDRFKLKSHWETRELPSYALVVDRTDGRLGPQLRPSRIDCATPPPDRPCGTRVLGAGVLRGAHVKIASLIGTLTTASGRLVQDRTGLTADFDMELLWTPEAFRLSAEGQTARRSIPTFRRSSTLSESSWG